VYGTHRCRASVTTVARSPRTVVSPIAIRSCRWKPPLGIKRQASLNPYPVPNSLHPSPSRVAPRTQNKLPSSSTMPPPTVNFMQYFHMRKQMSSNVVGREETFAPFSHRGCGRARHRAIAGNSSQLLRSNPFVESCSISLSDGT
jgi:hypothetical protein